MTNGPPTRLFSQDRGPSGTSPRGDLSFLDHIAAWCQRAGGEARRARAARGRGSCAKRASVCRSNGRRVRHPLPHSGCDTRQASAPRAGGFTEAEPGPALGIRTQGRTSRRGGATAVQWRGGATWPTADSFSLVLGCPARETKAEVGSFLPSRAVATGPTLRRTSRHSTRIAVTLARHAPAQGLRGLAARDRS